MSKPIKPSEVGTHQKAIIPAAVFDAFNAEIAANFSNGSARVQQADIVARLAVGGVSRDEVFKRGWLNVEEAYRAEGWDVTYDKPGYNESGTAFFVFAQR
jgi:hypothetical protein